MSDGEVVLVHLHPWNNRTGDKYRLSRNIKKIFTKYVCQGKATIQLHEPQIEIKFKNNAEILKKFMDLIQQASNYQRGSKQVIFKPLPELRYLPAPKQCSTAVSSVKELSKLPKEVISLTVSRCQMQTLHPEIMRFNNLENLDLSHNSLIDLPLNLGSLGHLTVLILNHNSFGCKADWKFLENSAIRNSLKVLELQHNGMTVVPTEIVVLKKLEKLMLDHNKLKEIPYCIGKMHIM